jgi:hypothetical protein
MKAWNQPMHSWVHMQSFELKARRWKSFGADAYSFVFAHIQQRRADQGALWVLFFATSTTRESAGCCFGWRHVTFLSTPLFEYARSDRCSFFKTLSASLKITARGTRHFAAHKNSLRWLHSATAASSHTDATPKNKKYASLHVLAGRRDFGTKVVKIKSISKFVSSQISRPWIS